MSGWRLSANLRRLELASRPGHDRDRVWKRVPRVSEFYGIVICTCYGDHGVPRFHAMFKLAKKL